MSALLIRREEVESWSDLVGLIPAGQQIYTAEEAHGNDETFAKRSSTKRSHHEKLYPPNVAQGTNH